MYKISIALIISLCSFNVIDAQYFYKDIVSNVESNQLFRLYKQNNIKQITVRSFFQDGETDNEFQVTQKINSSYTETVTTSKILESGENLIVNKYNEKGLVVKTIDSSDYNVNNTTYVYNDKGNVQEINTISSGANDYVVSEKHQWFYNEKGAPTYMLLIKNNNDTTNIKFTLDEKGLVAEEIHKRKGITINAYYYYYNDKNLLSDIVRFNEKNNRLLPDYTFDYDPQNRLIKMVQLEPAKNETDTWIYSYNEKELKTEEKVYFKNAGTPIGKVIYIYK